MTLADRVACDKLNRMLARRASRPAESFLDITCFGVYVPSRKSVVAVNDNYYSALALSRSIPFSKVITLRAVNTNNPTK